MEPAAHLNGANNNAQDTGTDKSLMGRSRRFRRLGRRLSRDLGKSRIEQQKDAIDSMGYAHRTKANHKHNEETLIIEKMVDGAPKPHGRKDT
jgi:hypothetical protein